MRPYRVSLLLSVCVWLPLLAGCGGDDSSEAPAVPAADASPPAESQPAPAAPAPEPAVEQPGSDQPPPASEAGSESQPAGNSQPADDSQPADMPPPGESSSESVPVPVSESEPPPEPPGPHDYTSETASSEDDSSASGTSQEYSGETPTSESYSSESPASEGYGPGATGAAAKPVTFVDRAQQMFRQGDDPQAFRFLHAHAVAADAAAAKELLDKMGFNPVLGRPTLAIRWGIGVEYNGPPAYSGDIFPIGTTQDMPIRPTARAASGDGVPEAAPGGTSGTRSGSDPTLQKLTGELGEKVVEQLRLRLDRGDYGQVYQAATAAPKAPGGYGGQPSYEAEGSYDSSPYAVNQGPGGPSSAGSGRERTLRSIAPGLTMIGVGSAKELLAAARQAGLHAVVLFKVTVAPNPRVRLIVTDTDLYLYDVVSNKELFRTRKALKNTDVQRHRVEGTDDGVAKVLVSLFEAVDQTWRLGPLPAMNPENVLDRIRMLLSQKTEAELLPALAEIRMYHTRGMLQDAHLLIAYQQLVGEELGRQLVGGSAEEKQQIVEGWLNPPAEEEEEKEEEKTGPRDILQQTRS